MYSSRSVKGVGPLSGAGSVPTPSDGTLIRLASIAAQVDEMLAADHPLNKAPVGVNRMKNDRRRAMEAILLLLADSEVQSYLGELERLGLLPGKR